MNNASPSRTPQRPPLTPRTIAVYVIVFLGVLAISYLQKRHPDWFGGGTESPTATQPTAEETSRRSDSVRDESSPTVEKPKSASRDNDVASEDRPPVPRKPVEKSGGLVQNVVVKDQEGKVVYRGAIDLEPVLDRIERGERLRFSHDGIVFQNRERRLPAQPGGYYHEYVVPTPGESGPGAQRLVLGKRGEVYYTFDHYRTFKKIREADER